MTDYIRNVIIIGVATSIIIIALPKNSEKSALYVKQLSSFVLLAVMLAPLKDLSLMTSALKSKLDGITSSVESTDSVMDADAVIGMSAEGICSYIVELCERKYGFDGDLTDVKLIIDDSDVENVIIKEIQVFVPVSDNTATSAVEEDLEELFGVKVFVFGVKLDKH